MESNRDRVRSASPSDYIARVGSSRLRFQAIQEIDVNGMDAATGIAKVRIDRGFVDVRLVAIRERPGRMYRFLFLTPAAATKSLATDLRRTTYSFKRLSASEARSISPLRLKVVTVKEGDTAESLSQQMPFDSYRLERFLAMNGLRKGQPLIPSQPVKIIAN